MLRVQLFLAAVMLPIAAVIAIYALLFVVVGASGAGAITGIVLGLFVFGGLIGWAIKAVARIPYPWADLISLVGCVVLTGFTNSSPDRPMVATWLTYGVGAVPAFLLLVWYHRAGRKPKPTSRQEPTA